MQHINIIGGGLAGSEAAWQLAQRGIQVQLHEMRPQRMTPAHHTDKLAELVCSNSFRADHLGNAVGLLHEEMRRLDSLIMHTADQCKLPAGGALAVDRALFAETITSKINAHPLIEVIHGEVTEIPKEGLILIASGPLTSDALYKQIESLTGKNQLSFFDAIAPIVNADSVNMDIAYWKSRYDKGTEEGNEGDYLNCPMNKEQYQSFVQALLSAEQVSFKDFEDIPFFEGCMPIEVMASRGMETLRFGPMKPVGLDHPRTGEKFYAVVQLRQDNRAKSLMNMVGFQTKMKYGDQLRVLRSIPALEEAEFYRLGSLHRNTFIRSPDLLDGCLRLKSEPRIFFAGQVTGVEGYVESSAMGLMAGIFMAAQHQGKQCIAPPEETAHGSLLAHISKTQGKHFQPMNINFGIMPTWVRAADGKRLAKKDRRAAVSQRALDTLDVWKENI
ncbi:MAG: methylenetetrahydrofolate--tRNA-(uracil(54)-C(5))-methyltransferase (FADH(2)-oxidizing) TrmFO [Mariprofundaceae bacterium]|nr:methylenetetrahydrofolate--tRNA-(uracil(54)-C(5))-methyltransferase (FADH(2)-oxidizing) TrmFO [Mariprofundaceae bacterium]